MKGSTMFRHARMFSVVMIATFALLSARCTQAKPQADRMSPTATPAVTGEEITYQVGGVELTGYLAYDANQKGQRPSILVVHEWWGHNDYVRRRAEQLAALGYTALAVDMYGDGTLAVHPQDARTFMMDVFSHMDIGEQRFVAAKEILERHSTTLPDQTAAIGYCFGGGVVLQMARNGVDLQGVISFHGNLAPHPSPAQAGRVKAKVLVLHGADDPLIEEQVEPFKEEMDAAGVDYRFVAYPGAVHAFTVPEATALGEQFGLPLAYDETADTQSWMELEVFLRDIFTSPAP